MKEDAAAAKAAIASGDYAGAMELAKGDFADLSADAQGAAEWGKAAAAEVQEGEAAPEEEATA